MIENLIRKYNVPGPRYTSYPTVPYWDGSGISTEVWESSLLRSLEESQQEGISLYIHLPFCESLCTFCGCHKRITKRHEVEDPYISTVLREWDLYGERLPFAPAIKEIHLGGGTPTFFSPANLERLINGILQGAKSAEIPEFSFEGHPNNTTKEHLQVLYDLGFRRVSYGVQDYDPQVQLAINRVQPFENVEKVHNWSKEIGYTSINHDLVFGLPHQTKAGIEHTIEKTLELLPDRLAFYSYAHVPWIKGTGQRGFDENDLPKDAEKRELYETGKRMFAENGYVEIGMDHFARKTDSLYKAMENGTLYRNFMGYTTTNTKVMIGLGMSSISDSWYAFAQNEKKLEDYQARVEAGEIPIFKGHLLNEEDLMLRQNILNIMCRFETEFEGDPALLAEIKAGLGELEEDGLVEISGNKIQVTEKGRPFVRNVCMAFDLKLQRNKPDRQIFSKTV
ncbi:oxygen-independent coproporphyrinogen III oxidase [Gracilimonas mengyeensis]|uniref:Coproporphyrinogen-III oxidase n=1 Tax=Gracilimonas mengyeensis TaxID=1302730 RepID=A0A521BB21_9BACT|nr:oxygen-independent coproporphyrinogen III oxidase [Gracilimonas mengyeensis]SMO44268.1 oxygen-independent coproporphyrinogen-3 oxidase [Gracilimonas mengyeensis]